MNKKLLIFFLLMLFSANVFAYIPKAEMKIFAVTTSNQGMDANLIIEIRPGNGKIYSNVNSQIGSSTQESERNSVVAVERVLPEIKGKYDYFFEIQSTASAIDGPSAGSAMALLLVSMLSDTDLSGKVSITGTITSDGYVGDVGGIVAKAKKASDIGIKLFMIPIGTRRQAITTDDGLSQVVDLPDHAYTNWGLKVLEVETIDDILKYTKMNIDDIDINTIIEKKEEVFFPEQISYSQALKPMKSIVSKYNSDAKKILEKTENSINNSTIKDSSIVQSLLSLVDYSKEAISSSEKNSINNYLYTSANEAFLAKIYLITIDEIVTNPSIISQNSTIYNLRIQEIEKKIALTENRAKNCLLDNLEWCASAKQRLVWAKNKIEEIKESNNYSTSPIDKVMNYSYALAWIEIANDFLNINVSENEYVFVESEHFKEFAQKYIIDLENQLILADESILKDEDFLRRFNAAKKDYELEWYITSLYDSASAKAVLISYNENKIESFDENIFLEKYNKLSELKIPTEMLSSENIWSKMFFDHSLYYYKQYLHYKSKNTTKAANYLKTANSVINIAKELYIVETLILSYYTDNENSILVFPENINKITINTENPQDTTVKPSQEQQNVYVYKKQTSSSSPIVIYVILAGLFIMIISIVIELEVHRNKKQKIQKEIFELEKKLIDGKISKFTYEDMKKSYLLELKEIEEKEKKRQRPVRENKIISEKESTLLIKKMPVKKPTAKKKVIKKVK